MDVELKPCPFCGEPVTLVEKDSGLLVFKCPDTSPCVGSGLGSFGRSEQRDTAIAAWNRRDEAHTRAAVEAERARCLAIVEPPLMHRKGRVGLWRQRRAEMAAAIRLEPFAARKGGAE